MESPTNEYIDIAFPLKSKKTIYGRLTNMLWVFYGIIATAIRYYWHGPEVKSWSLRFHVIRNVMSEYLGGSLPHDLPNDASARIDYRRVAEYISENELPSRPLTARFGYNRECEIAVTRDICGEYRLSSYPDSEAKLAAAARSDRENAEAGRPRTIQMQAVVGVLAARCSTCLSAGPPGPAAFAPWPAARDERIIIHFHGGAYCLGSRSLSHLFIYARMSSATGLRVFSPDYALAPRHCYPRQLHDCYITYMYFIRNGFGPENIILGGDSAGGSLALGLLLMLKDMGMPMPAGVMLISPWVDITCSGGASWLTNKRFDYLPSFPLTNPLHPVRMFYDPGRPFSDEMLAELQCPLISPAFGDLSGLPPMLIQAGDKELLRDDICAFAAKLKRQNAALKCPARLEIYDDMPHVFLLFDFAPAVRDAYESMADFVCSLQLYRASG